MIASLSRATALGVAAWLGAAGVTGTVAWRAVSVLDGKAERTGLLSESQVRATLDQQRMAALTSAATPGASPRPIPPTTPASVEVARTWVLDGGTVAASCTDTAIALLYATPADGWTVEVHSSGPEEVEVELAREPREIVVRAQCTDTEPVADVSEHSDTDEGGATTPPPPPSPRAPAPTTVRSAEPEDDHPDEADEMDEKDEPDHAESPKTED